MPATLDPTTSRFTPPTGWSPDLGEGLSQRLSAASAGLAGRSTVPVGWAPRQPGGTSAQPIDIGLGARSLYGPKGPQASDIQQNSLGDCYLVATLGAVARANPDAIRQMISYDPQTRQYAVKLYDDQGHRQTIRVDQGEVLDNVLRGGGSTADNTGRLERLWPSVIETAYAKMHDSNPADGLAEGYKAIGNGGTMTSAMHAITGDEGDVIRFSQHWYESDGTAMDRYAGQVQAALANGRPVTLATVSEPQGFFDKLFGIEPKQDGLVDGHLYMVEGMRKNADGEWMVTLRNPWNQNNGIGEGHDSASSVVTVPLSRLVETGGGWGFNAGPAR